MRGHCSLLKQLLMAMSVLLGFHRIWTNITTGDRGGNMSFLSFSSLANGLV